MPRRSINRPARLAVACVGCDNPEVKDAIVRRIDRLSYFHADFHLNSAIEDLERIFLYSIGSAMIKATMMTLDEWQSMPITADAHFHSQSTWSGFEAAEAAV
jgi:hypothetical protein